MSKIVKICGVSSIEAAQVAIESRADFIGVILVPNKKRTIEHSEAEAIAKLCKTNRKKEVLKILNEIHEKNLDTSKEYFAEVSKQIKENGPFLVGVFRNQPLEEVFDLADKIGLDFIQLHGKEDKLAFTTKSNFKYGINPRFLTSEAEIMKEVIPKMIAQGSIGIPLLDSESGGEGHIIDWTPINELNFASFILAGGLHPGNLKETAGLANIIGYDVSSGVENEDGTKNFDKIKKFTEVGKSL